MFHGVHSKFAGYGLRDDYIISAAASFNKDANRYIGDLFSIEGDVNYLWASLCWGVVYKVRTVTLVLHFEIFRPLFTTDSSHDVSFSGVLGCHSEINRLFHTISTILNCCLIDLTFCGVVHNELKWTSFNGRTTE